MKEIDKSGTNLSLLYYCKSWDIIEEDMVHDLRLALIDLLGKIKEFLTWLQEKLL
mgnify:CR=1 FL=1